MIEKPDGSIERDGKIYTSRNELIEVFEGKWRIVKNDARNGWWRYNSHYDRDGYCDNPARGY